MFLYSQLQNILPDSSLGAITDWDRYISLDFTDPALPFKSPDEFILNEDFHKLVLASKLPRPSKFVEQSISFCKAFCKDLLDHELVQSNLARGMAAFDLAVMVEGPETNYVSAIEKLSTHFVSTGWLSPSEKVKVVSQYRAFVTLLRASPLPEVNDLVQFLATHYEMQNRPELYQLFRYSCLCLPSNVSLPTSFEVPIAQLESGNEVLRSCVTSLQLSYQAVPNVSNLYRDPRTINRLFRLLGRGPELLTDKKFSVWNILKGSGPKRNNLQGKFEAAYRKAVLKLDKPVVPSNASTPTISRSNSGSRSPVSGPALGRAIVPVSRCANDNEEEGGSAPKGAKVKASRGKRS